MRRVIASLWVAVCAMGSASALAAEVEGDGALMPAGTWDFWLAEEGQATFPDGLWLGPTVVRVLQVTPDGLVGIGELPGGAPRALTDAGGAFAAPLWAPLHAGPCPDGQPPGERRWSSTPNAVRFAWLDVPLAGCPPGERASFSVELFADDEGQLSRLEYRYGVLPDGGEAEPRAGLVSPTLAAGAMEFFPDQPGDAVQGRAKLLATHSSDGESGVWVVELDGAGAVLDDPDLDGVRAGDNCRFRPNPRQLNIDRDDEGDACDDDDDNDLIDDDDGDNCPLSFNPDQADRDGDGLGDACDDGDGDRIVDALDRCPTRPDPAQLDLDDDGRPDACDDDIDGDGPRRGLGLWPAPADHCPYIGQWQWNQRDSDKDGLGDPCDVAPDVACRGFGCLFQADADGDGTLNLFDRCPTVAGDQADGDGDGIGDACDPDLDDDGVPDVYQRGGLACDPAVCPR